jgi:hypothetical protein
MTEEQEEKPQKKVWSYIHPATDEEEVLALCGFYENEDLPPDPYYNIVFVIPYTQRGAGIGGTKPKRMDGTLDLLIMRKGKTVARFRAPEPYMENIFGRKYKWPRAGFALTSISEERFEGRRNSMPTFSRF